MQQTLQIPPKTALPLRQKPNISLTFSNHYAGSMEIMIVNKNTDQLNPLNVMNPITHTLIVTLAPNQLYNFQVASQGTSAYNLSTSSINTIFDAINSSNNNCELTIDDAR
jgi:hypothetical protein